MYEFVKTANGWRIYWGPVPRDGADINASPEYRPERTAETPKAADQEVAEEDLLALVG